jgi:hypothetical protein
MSICTYLRFAKLSPCFIVYCLKLLDSKKRGLRDRGEVIDVDMLENDVFVFQDLGIDYLDSLLSSF